MTTNRTTDTPVTDALTRLVATYPDMLFSATQGEDGLYVAADRPTDRLRMEWLVSPGGEVRHLSTRYPDGTPNWQPHPDDLN